jgi:hypothetical protein
MSMWIQAGYGYLSLWAPQGNTVPVALPDFMLSLPATVQDTTQLFYLNENWIQTLPLKAQKRNCINFLTSTLTSRTLKCYTWTFCNTWLMQFYLYLYSTYII